MPRRRRAKGVEELQNKNQLGLIHTQLRRFPNSGQGAAGGVVLIIGGGRQKATETSAHLEPKNRGCH